jgi:hypothetical protein
MNGHAVGAIIVAVLAIGYLGFQVKPAPFASYPETSKQAARKIGLPSDLPGPVDVYFRHAYGNEIPVVSSVVITGRGRIRPFGLWMPARFRFTHDAGKGYRHYIEATWFGLAIMKVNESFLDGTGVMAMPWGESGGPEIEQAMNVSLWAELSSSAPSVFLTDERVEWEPVDEETALLKVPRATGDARGDTFVVRFSPDGTRIDSMEAMRFKAVGDQRKVLWMASSVGEKTIGHAASPAVGAATWVDVGKPWAYFEAEDIRYDVDVRDYIKTRGL